MPPDPPELPDDPSNWPTDPFALLGVEPGAAAAEVKRAYTRLIRRFKPEHAPEQFRRIREAYESCLLGADGFSPPVFRWDGPPADVARSAPARSDTAGDFRPPPAPPPAGDEVDRLWELAVGGDERAAYSGLADFAGRDARNDVPLRLYWLLGLNPALDPGRTRHDWLAAALRAHRLGGPAAELYRRELDADPNAALYGPYSNLLSEPSDGWSRLTVARWRVAAAGRSESWGPVAEDLKELARTLPQENEAAWLDLLGLASSWAVWSRPPGCYSFCRAELDKLRHLELRHAYQFDRVEEGEFLAAAWRAYLPSLGTAGLIQLVPHAWCGELHPEPLGRAVAEVAARPLTALAGLDRCPPEVGPVFTVLVLRALENYRAAHPPTGTGPEPDLIRGLSAGFPGGWRRDYPVLRGDLLGFLLAEAVDPFAFADACRLHPDKSVRTVSQSLRRDLALRAVWLACRLGD